MPQYLCPVKSFWQDIYKFIKLGNFNFSNSPDTTSALASNHPCRTDYNTLTAELTALANSVIETISHASPLLLDFLLRTGTKYVGTHPTIHTTRAIYGLSKATPIEMTNTLSWSSLLTRS